MKRRPAGRKRVALALVLAAAALGGCASRELVVLLPSESASSSGALAVSGGSGSRTVLLTRPLEATEVGLSGAVRQVALTDAELGERFGTIPDAMPKPPASYAVYFEFGRVDLTPASQSALEAALADLRTRPGAEVEVIGHTDTVGALADNDRLSRDRATVVGAVLHANAVEGRIITISGRGERELLVPTADEVREERNRRVEIVVR